MDLTGWSLQDTAGNILAFDENHIVGFTADSSSTIIAPGETRIIAVNGSSNSGVFNTGVDTLSLFWPWPLYPSDYADDPFCFPPGGRRYPEKQKQTIKAHPRKPSTQL